MNFFVSVLTDAGNLLLESSAFIIFGLLVSGLLRVFLNPNSVLRHFGQGRIKSVFKAALLGIPIPLCSCGVLPAAMSLKKQGANTGATTAFMISTPESGVDSISITYALLDPIMTVARPIAAFVTAVTAGVVENLFGTGGTQDKAVHDLTCPVDACCDGKDCPTEKHMKHHTFFEKTVAGLRYALYDVWSDLATWFLLGLLLAGILTALIPSEMISRYLGGGLHAMLLMLAVGIPMYICATASTPIAAALILKGVSPGAALVFLLVGPATNVTSLTVLFGVLGRRAAAIYLSTIALAAIAFGLIVDHVYAFLGISAQVMVGQAAEIVPAWVQWTGAVIILLLSIKPVSRDIMARLKREKTCFTVVAGGEGTIPEGQTPITCAGST